LLNSAKCPCAEEPGQMPFETVEEPAVVRRQIKVCRRCRKQIPTTVENRQTYNQVGSIAGSLGTSMGGSMVGAAAGTAVLPGVGTLIGGLGGAIGGAIFGGKAGAAASDKICDVVEDKAGDLCNECKPKEGSSSGINNWGGGRLGDGNDARTVTGRSSNSRLLSHFQPTSQQPSQARASGTAPSGNAGSNPNQIFGGSGHRLGEAAQPSSSPSFWACPQCTFHNASAVAACEMCECPRPSTFRC